MIRPDPQVVKALAAVVKTYPELLRFVDDWKAHELEGLPMTLTNTAVAQGRCQVLGELSGLLKKAPDIAARPDVGTQFNSTHTDRSV